MPASRAAQRLVALPEHDASASSRILRALAGKDQRRRTNLEKTYGSADYVHRGRIGLRDVFVKAVNEDQSPDLPRISRAGPNCSMARWTPRLRSRSGARMAALIPDARLTVLSRLRPHHPFCIAATTSSRSARKTLLEGDRS